MLYHLAPQTQVSLYWGVGMSILEMSSTTVTGQRPIVAVENVIPISSEAIHFSAQIRSRR